MVVVLAEVMSYNLRVKVCAKEVVVARVADNNSGYIVADMEGYSVCREC